MRRVRKCATTGKTKFSGRDKALRAIAKILASQSPTAVMYLCKRCGKLHAHRPAWRAYKCTHCETWHLASSKPACSTDRIARAT